MKFLLASTTSSTTTAINSTLLLLFVVTGTTEAFSSMAVPPPATLARRQSAGPPPPIAPTTTATTTPTTTVSSESWRIVLDIGREPLANGMPFNWARSGCRMPLKIPSQFVSMTSSEVSSSSSSSTTSRTLEPISDTVSFTGPDGAVVRPVQGGSWTLSTTSSSELGKPKELTFDLTFPQALARRDVTIDAGSTLQCVTAVYTQSDLDYLNQEYYQARQEAWDIGRELNDISARREAPKRWNFETSKWEKRHEAENPLTWMQKQAAYWKAKANQDAKNRQRPDPNTLSAMGRLPGVDEYVYVKKTSGIVKAASNGAVMGTWQAEPINDKPISYRNS